MVILGTWGVKCAYYEGGECIDIGMRYCCECTEHCAQLDIESQHRNEPIDSDNYNYEEDADISDAAEELAKTTSDLTLWVDDNVTGFRKHKIFRLLMKFLRKAEVLF